RACGAVSITLIGLIRFNVYVDANGVLEPEHREVLNAKQGGFVSDIRAHDAQWVKQGDILLVLSDPELDTEIKKLQATLRAAQTKEQQSRGSGDMAQNRLDQLSVATYTDQLKEAIRRHDELTVRAPIDGQIVAPEMKFLPGRYMQRGTELLRVETNDKLVVRSVVEQREVALASQLKKEDGHI